MRLAPRVALASFLVFVGMCPSALAAGSLSVFTDSSEIALGGATTLAVQTATDDAFGGGHIALKYKGADAACAATPDADDGTDAVPSGQLLSVPAGAGVTNIGGQTIQLDVGYWRICGWLIDDSMGAVVWQASSIVHVLPFSGSLSIAIDRHPRGFQFTLTYASSSPGRVYASLQRAARPCPRNPDRISKKSILLVPRAGRFVASDGGLGRAISAKRLSPGRWRVCSWLRADEGAVGPASRTFAVRRRRVAHAAG